LSALEKRGVYFVDETGIDKYYEREYGRSLRGERVYGEFRGRKFKRTSIVSAYKKHEIVSAYKKHEVVAPFEYDGTMDGGLFEGWCEQMLLPCIEPKSVIVLDNARIHKRSYLYEIAESNNVTLLFLPPYSPDLNPIEKLWANLKRFLRHFARNYKTIQEAISDYFKVE
jgi:transposase